MLAYARVLVGVTLTVAPRQGAQGWIGRNADKAPAQVLSRALGVRDAAMGVGVLLSVDDVRALRPWLAACVAADAVDCAASLAARDELPRAGGLAVSVVAAASAACSAALAAKLS